MAKIGRRPWPACRVPWRCLWSKAFTLRFRCIGGSSKTRNFAAGGLTPILWSASSSARNSVVSTFSPKCRLPRLYPILDAGLLQQAGLSIALFAQQLRDAGIRFLQYRDKEASDA